MARLSLLFFYLLPGTKTKRNQDEAQPQPTPPLATYQRVSPAPLVRSLHSDFLPYLFRIVDCRSLKSVTCLRAFVFRCEILIVAGVYTLQSAQA